MQPLRVEGKQTCSRQLSPGKRTSKLSGLSSERQPEQTTWEGFMRVGGCWVTKGLHGTCWGLTSHTTEALFFFCHFQPDTDETDDELWSKATFEKHKASKMINSAKPKWIRASFYSFTRQQEGSVWEIKISIHRNPCSTLLPGCDSLYMELGFQRISSILNPELNHRIKSETILVELSTFVSEIINKNSKIHFLLVEMEILQSSMAANLML